MTAPSGDRLARAKSLGAAALLLALGVAAGLAIAGWKTEREARRGDPAVLARFADEVGRQTEAVERALRATDEQYRAARHLIGWMAEGERGGSAQLIGELRMLRFRHDLPIQIRETEAISDLDGSNRLENSDVGRRLRAFRHATQEAVNAGRQPHERFVTALEQALPAAEWQLVFDVEGVPPATGVDYRAALRILSERQFDRELRTALRGLGAYRQQLSHVHALGDSLRVLLDHEVVVSPTHAGFLRTSIEK